MTSQAHEVYYENPNFNHTTNLNHNQHQQQQQQHPHQHHNHQHQHHNPQQHSPGTHRQPQHQQHHHHHHPVQRQPSRPFDAYNVMPPPPSLYSTEDHSVQNYMPRYPDGRMNATLGASGYHSYDTWSPSPFGGQNNTLGGGIGGTSRRNPLQNRPGRSGLPSNWVDPPSIPGIPSFSGLDGSLDNHMLRGDAHPVDEATGEDLIPTAIVIKNIPFAVKKEFLVGIMTEMGLPLPYAFNYHFDQGVFRGLAFANFTTAEETAMVISRLNHYELQGRKLRVEYKKMLPLAERERIEREKRIKRGQLEEQHRSMPGGGPSQLNTQSSLSSLTSQLPATSPSPVSSRPRQNVPGPMDLRSLPPEVDFNDPSVLTIYSELVVFKSGKEDEMSYPHTLAPTQRRLVHTLAHHLHLGHVSRGEGNQRAVHIFKYTEAQISPSNLPVGHPVDTHRRALNRAATTDFSDVRSEGFYGGPTVTRQTSGFLAGLPDSPALQASHNLRAAKSYADLRAYTPSPAQSLPSNMSNNLARFAEYGAGSTGASNPNLTATSNPARDENMMINGLSAMSLGGAFGAGGSPRSTRNLWERDASSIGAIGSNRGFASTQSLVDESQPSRGQLPQPQQRRGPAPERGPAIPGRNPRQNGHMNGRSSDELRQQSSIDHLQQHQSHEQ